MAYSVGRQDPLTQNVRIQRTLRAYRLLFSDLYRPVQLRSLELSAACLVVCIGVGVPSAVAVSRASPRTQRSLLLAILLPSS